MEKINRLYDVLHRVWNVCDVGFAGRLDGISCDCRFVYAGVSFVLWIKERIKDEIKSEYRKDNFRVRKKDCQ